MKLNEYELKRLKKERMEEIDKWLDNEYGCSYTRLEELHDFVVEQDLKHRDKAEKEIERLNNIIKRLEEDLREMYLTFGEFSEEYTENKIKELKGEDKE